MDEHWLLQDLARAWKVAESLEYGMIGVNEVGAEPLCSMGADDQFALLSASRAHGACRDISHITAGPAVVLLVVLYAPPTCQLVGHLSRAV